MTFDDYQDATGKTAIYPKENALVYTALGVSSEVGELAGEVKRIYRDDGGTLTLSRREKIGKEIGDILWYLSEHASSLGFRLSDLAQRNLDKLDDRMKRGVIQGEGGER